jgi:hypothetical protein
VSLVWFNPGSFDPTMMSAVGLVRTRTASPHGIAANIAPNIGARPTVAVDFGNLEETCVRAATNVRTYGILL